MCSPFGVGGEELTGWSSASSASQWLPRSIRRRWKSTPGDPGVGDPGQLGQQAEASPAERSMAGSSAASRRGWF
ncbi:hypothetical protein P4123_10360 [Pseudomonas aeruginosa]|nr:hypothetical protein [Pseudomonas aeruginosa]